MGKTKIRYEEQAYTALLVLADHAELSYNAWRFKSKANTETMTKIRDLLLTEDLIKERKEGKQSLMYSINHARHDNQNNIVDHVITPYSKVTASFTERSKIIKTLKKHQRILNNSIDDIKTAKEFWNNYAKDLIDGISLAIEQERMVNLVICNPVIKTPYKVTLEKTQKKFYESLREFFKNMHDLEPILFMTLWEIIFYKLNNTKPTT